MIGPQEFLKKKRSGALPDIEIHELIKANAIIGADAKRVNPASLNVSLSEEIYIVPGTFLPRSGEAVSDALKKRNAVRTDFSKALSVGTTYLVKLNESFALPTEVYAYANPRSTTGRNDISAHVIADSVTAYDTLPRHYVGNCWILVTPESYPIILGKNSELMQIRFFNSDTRLDSLGLELAFRSYGLAYIGEASLSEEMLPTFIEDGRVVFTVNLGEEIIGYKAKSKGMPLQFSEISAHDPEDFFETIKGPQDELCIKQGEFFLLKTFEKIRVPPTLAAEVEALDARSGNFIAHKAGYIDPGYGYGKNGEIAGLAVTLEVRAVGRNIILQHRQRICRVIYEELRNAPETPYSGSYKIPRMLPKQFIDTGIPQAKTVHA